MAQRLIHCVKLDKELPGLETAPFKDALGEEIYQKVSQEAWNQWKDDMMIKIINEYRLNLADAEHYSVLIEQMKAFLHLSASDGSLEVENPDRGK